MSVEERLAIVETTLDTLVTLAHDTDKRMDRMERIMWQGVAILATAVVLANILGPVIAERILP